MRAPNPSVVQIAEQRDFLFSPEKKLRYAPYLARDGPQPVILSTDMEYYRRHFFFASPSAAPQPLQFEFCYLLSCGFFIFSFLSNLVPSRMSINGPRAQLARSSTTTVVTSAARLCSSFSSSRSSSPFENNFYFIFIFFFCSQRVGADNFLTLKGVALIYAFHERFELKPLCVIIFILLIIRTKRLFIIPYAL